MSSGGSPRSGHAASDRADSGSGSGSDSTFTSQLARAGSGTSSGSGPGSRAGRTGSLSNSHAVRAVSGSGPGSARAGSGSQSGSCSGFDAFRAIRGPVPPPPSSQSRPRSGVARARSSTSTDPPAGASTSSRHPPLHPQIASLHTSPSPEGTVAIIRLIDIYNAEMRALRAQPPDQLTTSHLVAGAAIFHCGPGEAEPRKREVVEELERLQGVQRRWKEEMESLTERKRRLVLMFQFLNQPVRYRTEMLALIEFMVAEYARFGS